MQYSATHIGYGHVRTVIYSQHYNLNHIDSTCDHTPMFNSVTSSPYLIPVPFNPCGATMNNPAPLLLYVDSNRLLNPVLIVYQEYLTQIYILESPISFNVGTTPKNYPIALPLLWATVH